MLGEGGGWVLIHNLQLVQVRANVTGVCWGDEGDWELLQYLYIITFKLHTQLVQVMKGTHITN